MPKKDSAQIYECRDAREDILCPNHDAVGFIATREGGQIRITNCGSSPISIVARRRPVQPGGHTLVQRDVPLQVGERKFVCK